MRAQAVVATAPSEVAVAEVEVPEPGPEDVVVHVLHSWISNGTEGSFLRGERMGGDTPRRDTDPQPFPHVPGYQKVGIVERVGGAVENLARGDLVFVSISRVSGMFYGEGGHVSPAVAHRSQVWRLPAGADPLAYSGLVLAQVGFNCGTTAPLARGDATVVLGDGLVGHWSAQTLASRGARVLLVGRHADRLAKFRPRPGDAVLDAESGAPLNAVRRWAPDGVQVVVDTVGSVPAMQALYPCLRRGAHLVSAGFHRGRGLIDIQPMRDRELALHAPSGWTRERVQQTMEMVGQGELQTLPLITHRFPMRQAALAYHLILRRTEPCLGVVLDWN